MTAILKLHDIPMSYTSIARAADVDEGRLRQWRKGSFNAMTVCFLLTPAGWLLKRQKSRIEQFLKTLRRLGATHEAIQDVECLLAASVISESL